MARCAAQSKRSQTQCKRAATRGAVVCSFHGSRAPQVKRKAAQRVMEQDALRALAKLEVSPIDDPLEELGKLAAETATVRDILRVQVSELPSLITTGLVGDQVQAIFAVYGAYLDRHLRAVTALAKVKSDERLVKISEDQAAAVVDAIEQGLSEVGIPGHLIEQARRATGRHLRAIGETA